jgi:uncharacterized membrane protein
MSRKKPSAAEDTARLETFSDGVFAIAITLLILEIELPEGNGLAARLWDTWPSYMAYVLSFVTIGIMWANHHGIFRLIERVTHGLIVSNLLLLLMVGFIPFPTNVLAAQIRNGRAEQTAAVFYGGTFTVTAAFYLLLWLVAARGNRLISKGSEDAAAEVTRRYRYGVPSYLVATLVALWSWPASIALNAAIAGFYLLPRREAV